MTRERLCKKKKGGVGLSDSLSGCGRDLYTISLSLSLSAGGKKRKKNFCRIELLFWTGGTEGRGGKVTH